MQAAAKTVAWQELRVYCNGDMAKSLIYKTKCYLVANLEVRKR